MNRVERERERERKREQWRERERERKREQSGERERTEGRRERERERERERVNRGEKRKRVEKRRTCLCETNDKSADVDDNYSALDLLEAMLEYSRVTRRPLLPGHVLFSRPKKYVRQGFQNLGPITGLVHHLLSPITGLVHHLLSLSKTDYRVGTSSPLSL